MSKPFVAPPQLPNVTTAQRDAIPAGRRPPGSLIFNTTLSKVQVNAGTDAVPVWASVGEVPVLTVAQWPPASPAQDDLAILSDTTAGLVYAWTFKYRPDLDATYPWAAVGTQGRVCLYTTNRLEMNGASAWYEIHSWAPPRPGLYYADTGVGWADRAGADTADYGVGASVNAAVPGAGDYASGNLNGITGDAFGSVMEGIDLTILSGQRISYMLYYGVSAYGNSAYRSLAVRPGKIS